MIPAQNKVQTLCEHSVELLNVKPDDMQCNR
jgi:hypothetical protein